VRVQGARGFAKRAAMLTGARAGRTFVASVAGAALDLGPLPDRAQYEEQRQGHEWYEQPWPHRRKALVGRAGATAFGCVLGHRRQRE
jgi:hypothetical protein